MKNILLTWFFCASFSAVFSQTENQNIITTDIDHFWEAYDKIITTKDSVAQYGYLNSLFLAKGSPGLKSIMEVRDYTAKSYLDAINSYPLFWNSIRNNTLKTKDLADSIAIAVQQMKKTYPNLRPAQIYFTIGALRTGGTTLKDRILIGSEIAMADKNTITTEFPQTFSHLGPHFKSNPIDQVVFTNIHEYVHTQQKTTIASTLLGQCVLEGAAEFVAVLSTGKESTTPSMKYGEAHEAQVRNKFATQLYNPFNGFWLYTNAANEFNQRDMGYYVGYAICQKYYNGAKDKQQAIIDMIELDYDSETTLTSFVEKSGYFKKGLANIKAGYEKGRPTVSSVKPFRNRSKEINPSLTEITVTFSENMDKRFRNFEYGPLGQSNLLKITAFKSFSEDGKSATFEVEVQPGKNYQIVLGPGFRSLQGISLQPYLLEFSTAAH
ncbi:Ig-like domain-containing protein [Pedobacter duraquae]|uniref:Putative Zn-dependent protease DUF2268 n=1 Tax=Pedobacter duraquae TaxID=425511 RepID=A0A4R6ILE4_9SPHI|nr:Ig-like domain-containing protein [Pedobacter duraquae]TDO22913.1 putative Zn-dependent protease DUF2268 [Pedobacter duraquae]